MLRIIYICLLIFPILLSTINLAAIPSGAYWDELDNLYQSYSLLKTGRDYFGNPFPVILHSFADYKTSLYPYSAVPITAIFGLNIFSIRFTSCLWGAISLLSFFVLFKSLFPKYSKISAIFVTLLMGTSIWHFQYSRIGFETITSIATLIPAIASLVRKKTKLAIVLFTLSINSYSPNKLFIPIFLLCIYLFTQYLNRKTLIIIAVLCTPFFVSNYLSNGNSRFENIAVHTDPTLRKSIDYVRLQSSITRHPIDTVGIAPNLFEKAIYNFPFEIVSRIYSNYISAFSPEFLFLKGDPQLRHSPGTNTIGMFSSVLALPILLGLVLVYTYSKKNISKLLLIWLLLSPLSSSLTRDGGTHASRLIIMLPILAILTGVGLKNISSKKILSIPFYLLLIITIFSPLYYYFTTYRFESLRSFQSNYDQIISMAIDKSAKYPSVILDMGNDSALMAYLVYANVNPRDFQKMLPLKSIEVSPGVRGNQFKNITILYPGSRNWSEVELSQDSFVFQYMEAPDKKKINSSETRVKYINGTDVFRAFEALAYHPSK